MVMGLTHQVVARRAQSDEHLVDEAKRLERLFAAALLGPWALPRSYPADR